MKRVRTKAAILGAVAVLAAAVVISGAPAATGQESAGPVPVEPLDAPPVAGGE